MRHEVEWRDVEEALRLMQMSKVSLSDDTNQRRRRRDDTTVIFETVKELLVEAQQRQQAAAGRKKARRGSGAEAPAKPVVALQSVLDRLDKRFTREQIDAAIDVSGRAVLPWCCCPDFPAQAAALSASQTSGKAYRSIRTPPFCRNTWRSTCWGSTTRTTSSWSTMTRWLPRDPVRHRIGTTCYSLCASRLGR